MRLHSALTSSAGNAEQPRNLPRVADVQVTHDLNSVPLNGFTIVDRDGGFVAWSACIVAALQRYKGDPLCDRIERCSDGAVLAYKRRAARAPGWKHRFEESVAA